MNSKEKKKLFYKKGSIVWVEFDRLNEVNREQQGKRPCIVVQNDIGNKVSPTTIVVPLTSSKTKTDLPVHVHIGKENFPNTKLKDSTALCEQVRVIDSKRIVWVEKCVLSTEIMNAVDQALLVSLGYGEDKDTKVVWIRLTTGIGCEQRSENPLPAIVLQNDIGNKHAPTLIVAPLGQKKNKMLPTQVLIPGNQVAENFNDSVALLEQIRVIDKSRITFVNNDVNLSQEVAKGIEKALLISLGIQKK